MRQRNKDWYGRNPVRARDWRLRKNFGIGIADYDMLFAAQFGVCAICKRPSQDRQNLLVDHCHVTGKVRGLLCFKCNTGLGCFNDDFTDLLGAIDYLQEAKLRG